MLAYRAGALFVDDVPLSTLAEHYGTPCYVYSKSAIEACYQAYAQAFAAVGRAHAVCFAVKANSNLGVLRLLAHQGAGFDIVSQGELERVLAAGGAPERIVFSGVGKTAQEIKRALLVGIGCFNVESIAELQCINAVAATLDQKAPVALRINPNVDVETHPYIATGLREHKFGIGWQEAASAYHLAAELPFIEVCGLACHIGSQITSLEPYREAVTRLLPLWDELQAAGITLQHLNVGGGLGIAYQESDTVPAIADWVAMLNDVVGERKMTLKVEPGRSIVGAAGLLLTRVLYTKQAERKQFAVVDAAMNDLLRPALYQAWQAVWPVKQRSGKACLTDIVGPVCESGDVLASERELVLAADDLLVIADSGAYGFCMSSNYNTRARAPEVMVCDSEHVLVRRRETLEELFASEDAAAVAPWLT